MNFKCVDGEWRPLDILMQVGKGLICRPECPKGCLNGGYCVAPSTCLCPERFIGTNCGKGYTLTVRGVPCRFPFMYKRLWRHGCTGEDNPKPWCATAVDPGGRIASTGTCVADLVSPSSTTRSVGVASAHPNGLGSGALSRWMRMGHLAQWDFCQPDYGVESVAFTQEGFECQLPFSLSGRNFYGCVEGGGRHPGNLWCATSVSTDDIIFFSSVCMLDLDGRVLEEDNCIENLTTHKEDGILPALAKRGIPCVFPFRHNGRLHHSCVSGQEGKDGAWCATAIDASGRVVARESCPKKWAYGSLGPITSEVRTLYGMLCIFPFTLEGQVYYGCFMRHSGDAVCATMVDEINQVVALGICPKNGVWRPLSVLTSRMDRLARLGERSVDLKILITPFLFHFFPFSLPPIPLPLPLAFLRSLLFPLFLLFLIIYFYFPCLSFCPAPSSSRPFPCFPPCPPLLPFPLPPSSRPSP
ncbi:putative epididymal sperm-binding protein 1-like [Penaeus vannamei]|uniref:Putative epididymal sperm-binding protein 1-like n=1 Tax=Penaeus vannamei TaxID=6689 RepID=A0A3R7SU10_PENVA|nr:putative epididymal sperm-binding protein 1-like [Penaeus vannamei]